MMHTQQEFDDALKVWLEGAQAISDRNMERFPHALEVSGYPKLETQAGKKYIRVVRDHSAHAFIEIATGDVLKPDGWKRPAKHARGNIFDESNGLQWMGPYGPAYLR
jgi:hypothetical protein